MKVKSELARIVSGFAGEIIGFYKAMVFCGREFVISKRLLKSGSEIDSCFKNCQMDSAYKRAVETEFWLRMAKSCGYKKLLGVDGSEKNVDYLLLKARNLVELLDEKEAAL